MTRNRVTASPVCNLHFKFSVKISCAETFDNIMDKLDGVLDAASDGRTEADPFFRFQRLAPDDIQSPAHTSECLDRLEDHLWIHAVRIEGYWLSRIDRFDIRFDEIYRPGFFPARRGIDQNRRIIVAIEHLVGQVNPSDAKISNAYPFGKRLSREPLYYLHSKTVVLEENVANTCDEHSLLHKF